MKTIRSSLIIMTLALIMLINGCDTYFSSQAIYEPSQNSPFRIMFTYPSEWTWESLSYDLMAVDIYPDSRKSTIWLYINVYVTATPEKDMLDRINLFMETKDVVPKLKIVEDKMLEIDGQPGRWFVTHATGTNRTSPDEPYIAEDIFVFAEDRFYIIGIQYTESETNPRFYQEFLDLIESIQFLP